MMESKSKSKKGRGTRMEKKAGEQVFAGMVDEVLATRIVDRAERNKSQSTEEAEKERVRETRMKHDPRAEYADCRRKCRGVFAVIIGIVAGVIGLIALTKFLKRAFGRD